MNNPCLLMLSGEAPRSLALKELRNLLKRGPYIVAADGGAMHLATLGLKPDMLMGDGDSLDNEVLARYCADGVSFTPLPSEKDYTDGDAAFKAALEAGCREIAIFGALGGSLDHQLGNLLLPLSYQGQWDSCVFYGTDCRAHYCAGQMRINGRPGDIVSLLPLSPLVKGLTLRGLRYPLNGAEIAFGNNLCLRNELSEAQGSVEFAEGMMLVMHFPINI